MIISLVKRQKGKTFVENLENQYKTIENLEKIVDKTNNMKLLVDLDNWKYYVDHSEELIEEEFTFISDDLSFNEIDYAIISIIKSEHPNSIRELSAKLNKNISTVQPHVKKLEKQGIIEFINGNKNNSIPVCDFDAIKIEF
ncbi:MAG: winged helix-turn-helix domain-containing protein [Methanosphaera sp.]|nr:winged helix-turn-helix domain-containing protein [Methanosphaera sp.]